MSVTKKGDTILYQDRFQTKAARPIFFELYSYASTFPWDMIHNFYKKSAKMEGITQEKMQGYENMNAFSEKIIPNCKGVRIRTKRALALQVPACTSQCLILALT